MITNEQIEQFIAQAHRVGDAGLTICSSGNISWRIGDEVLLSGTGSWVPSLPKEKVSVCKLSTGEVLNGVKPSMESGFHLGVLRERPDVNVVLHFQSHYATAVACMENRPTNFNVTAEIPCHVGSEIPVVPYYRPGSKELAQGVIDGLKDHNSVLLLKHGQVVCGKDFDEAFERAMFFEMACRIIIQSGGNYTVLTPEEIDVIAVGSHDTASAVYAVPVTARDAHSRIAYLSSGTWSLLGVELDEPILTEEARLAGFTNEGGVGGKIRFLQNITGLWILQRLMAQWKERGEDTDYETLITAAECAETDAIINVDDEAFQSPMDMEKAIAGYCRAHSLAVPDTCGEYVLCILKSLAQRYKQGVSRLNSLLPSPVTQLHIIGGGCRNRLLNRLTEEALGIPVYAGPVEATAIGNILIQALAKGDIRTREEITEII